MNKDELALELGKIWDALDHLDPIIESIEETGGPTMRIDYVRSELYDICEWIWELKERIEKEEAKQKSFDDDVEDDFEDLAQQRGEDARDAYE